MGVVHSTIPKVLVAYPGPSLVEGEQDIFVYLRPETNDVRVESAVLRVIEQCSAYKKDLHLVYLANVPGEFILEHHIVERHYSLKLEFAVRGGEIFTPHMRDEFQRFFAVPFDEADVIGAYEALRKLHLSPDELFRSWVPESDLLVVNGQSVKRMSGYFVVNYDIPAVLHKNNRGTDIAVMIFRTAQGYDYFNGLVDQMRDALVRNELLNARVHPSRAFHYSKGPFEQILDGFGYLFTPDISFASLSDLTFSTYLAQHGIDFETIKGVIRHPILQFGADSGPGNGTNNNSDGISDGMIEEHLFTHTMFDSYPRALEKLNSMVAQVVLPGGRTEGYPLRAAARAPVVSHPHAE